MTVYLQYSASLADTPVSTCLANWSSAAGSGTTQSGTLYPSSNASQYAAQASASTAAFFARGSFNLSSRNPRVLYGSADSVSLGAGLSLSGSGFALAQLQANFLSLGLSSSQTAGVNGSVHQLLYSGLRQGSTAYLSSVIQALLASAVSAYNAANGTSLSFAQMTFGQFASVGAASVL